jgi:hypothetical protein
LLGEGRRVLRLRTKLNVARLYEEFVPHALPRLEKAANDTEGFPLLVAWPNTALEELGEGVENGLEQLINLLKTGGGGRR